MSTYKKENLQIVRLRKSSYQSSNYLEFESRRFDELTGTKYCFDKVPDQGKLILITNTQLNFNSITEDVLKRTQLIIHPNSGFDNIPKQLLTDYSFPIILGNPIRANAVVEYTLGSLFHHFSSVPYATQWENGRKWPRQLLKDQNIQIIGHGHIGKLLKLSLTPLCKNLWIKDPNHNESNWYPEKANVIIMAASLDTGSKEILNAKVFNKLKEDIVIINGARGALIKQDHLINFLHDNLKSVAYLDVFEREPFKSEFEGLKNVFLSSHIAGVYNNLDSAIANYVRDVVDDFIKNENFDKIYQHLNLKNFKDTSFLC